MRAVFVAAIGALAAFVTVAGAQSQSVFTYQGELRAGGQAAFGSHDMVFRLFDAASGGAQVGSTLTHAGIEVERGLFTVALDFGASAFDNSGRWLEIEVEGVILSPRQPVTRSPYSIQTRGIFVNDNEQIGIGTTDPQHLVHAEAQSPEMRMTATGSGSTDYPRVQLQGGLFPSQFAPLGGIEFFDSDGVHRGGIYGNKSGPDASQMTFSVIPGELAPLNLASTRVRVKDRLVVIRGTDLASGAEINSDGSDSFLQALGGRLAIGHDAPVAPLDVEGNAFFRDRLGIGTSSPQYPLHVVDSGIAVYAQGSNGVYSVSDDSNGKGAIFGYGRSPTGSSYGVYGRSDSPTGQGIIGFVGSSSGTNYGVKGTTISQAGYGVYGANDNPSGFGIGVYGKSLGPNGTAMYGYASNTTGTNIGVRGGSASPNGYDFYASGAGVNYGSSSSRRWKHEVTPIDGPLDKLARLRGVYFRWDAEHGGHHDVGMIAEEVGAVLPEIVVFEDNGIDAEGMDYSKMTPLLVEAVNALRSEKDSEIAALRRENEAMRARLEALERMVVEAALRRGRDGE